MYSNDSRARDGYRVAWREVPEDQVYEMCVALYLNGSVELGPVKIMTTPLTQEGRVEMERVQPIMMAMCRYLNSGGQDMRLSEIREDFYSFVETANDEVIPDEFTCVGFGEDDYAFQTIFRHKTDGNYLIVAEDCHSEELTGEEFMAVLDAAE